MRARWLDAVFLEEKSLERFTPTADAQVTLSDCTRNSMKHCQICGTVFDGETCHNCGEASWIEAQAPVANQSQGRQPPIDNRKGKR